jgi:hypothetical protein
MEFLGRLLRFCVLAALTACSGAATQRVSQRNGAAIDAPGASVAVATREENAGSDTTSAEGNARSVTVPVTSEAPPSTDYPQAGLPTLITGAYLAAYRDAPADVVSPTGDVLVYAVVRGADGKPLPKPLPIEAAFATFDDGSRLDGTIDADVTHAYHAIFRVPAAQLASDDTAGKDRVLGALSVQFALDAKPKLSTDVVIWLANVGLTVERGDYGTVLLPPAGSLPAPIKVFVAVSSADTLPPRQVLLKGLGSELAVSGGSCPKLSEAEPVELAADCTVELVPTGVGIFDRVLTLSYDNGVRADFASVALRGEAALVLGQPDGRTAGERAPLDDPRAFLAPGVAFKAGKLLVTDRNRVRIFNQVPRTSFVAPDVLVGDGLANGPVNAEDLRTLGNPESDGTNLMLADSLRNRVLVWSKMPTRNGVLADVVIGQPTMTDVAASTGLAGLSSPSQVLWDGTHLAVVSSSRGPPAAALYPRARVWNGVPTQNGASCAATFGAPFVYATPEPGRPIGVLSFDGHRYFESFGDRIYVYDSWPLDFAHPVATIGSEAATPPNLAGARLVASDGTRIAVVRNSSVLVWSSLPTRADAPPDFILGQSDASTGAPNAFGSSIDSLARPSGVAFIGDMLAIADTGNGRVILRAVPRARPELVLPPRLPARAAGDEQPGLLAFHERFRQLGVVDSAHDVPLELTLDYSGTSPAAVTASSFDDPSFAFVGGAYPGTGGTCGATIAAPCKLQLFVRRRSQNAIHATLRIAYDNGLESRDTLFTVLASPRYLAKRSLPISRLEGHMAASSGPEGRIFAWDANYCHARLVGSGADAVAAIELSVPSAAAGPCAYTEDDYSMSDAFVLGSAAYLQLGNSSTKVAVWSPLPAASSATPDRVIDVSSGEFVAASFARGLRALGGKTVRSVRGNNPGKVGLSVWGAPPANAGVAADLTVSTAYELPFNEDVAYFPGFNSDASDGQRYFVADSANNRVVGWKGIPAEGAPPDFVLGQLNPDGIFANDGGLGPWSLSTPTAMWFQDGELFVVDVGNHRIQVFDTSLLP